MSKRPHFNDVSEILFRHDPAGTCCVENDCHDEYDYVAMAIVNDRETVKNIFDDYFDGHYDKAKLNKAEEEIAKLF